MGDPPVDESQSNLTTAQPAARRWDETISMWVSTCKGCPSEVTSKRGTRLWCDDCVAENNRKGRRAYYQANRAKELAYHREHKYGMSDEDIRAALAAQDGNCPVCLDPIPDDEISVDHDHETGVFRGILHARCNSALGFLQDDPDRCDRAAAYLRRPVFPLAIATGPGMTVIEPTTCTVCGRHGTRAYIPNRDGTYRCKDGNRCRRSAARQAAGTNPRGRVPLDPPLVSPVKRARRDKPPTRLNRAAVERHVRRTIAERRLDPDRALISVVRLPDAVQVHVNSDDNAVAAENALAVAGYVVKHCRVPGSHGYGTGLLVSLAPADAVATCQVG